MPENVPFNKEEFAWESNPFSEVDKVIAVASGKGGVGKSLVTSLLACAAAKDGKETAIMDADVTGPSIPKAFGLRGMLSAIEGVGIEPAIADNGIKVVSMNLLLEDEEAPVVWRGPVVAGVLQQFWKDVDWGKVSPLRLGRHREHGRGGAARGAGAGRGGRGAGATARRLAGSCVGAGRAAGSALAPGELTKPRREGRLAAWRPGPLAPPPRDRGPGPRTALAALLAPRPGPGPRSPPRPQPEPPARR